MAMEVSHKIAHAGFAGLAVLLKRRRKAKAEPPPEDAADSDPDAEKVGARS